jgi:site-specific recombinase XerD
MVSTPDINSSKWSEANTYPDWEQNHRGYASQKQVCADQSEHMDDTLSGVVDAWLFYSYPYASSESTPNIYRKILTSLRVYLRSQGLDLNSPQNQLTPQIQTWANLRTSGSKWQGEVAPATYNQRIAAINGFYIWAAQSGIYTDANPVEQFGRQAVRKYAGSSALDVEQVRHRLQKIDCSTTRGLRDYILLQVALNTGRSARELANLTWGSLSFQGENVTLAFEGKRGGKVMYDTLDGRLSHMLFDYLRAIYSEPLTDLSPQVPIWISFSARTYRRAIGQQTIADICETHLGISQIQKLRHTFAFTMDQLGAPTEIIQARLGHESRSTTDTYLSSLKRAYNPYATMLANTFGL